MSLADKLQGAGKGDVLLLWNSGLQVIGCLVEYNAHRGLVTLSPQDPVALGEWMRETYTYPIGYKPLTARTYRLRDFASVLVIPRQELEIQKWGVLEEEFRPALVQKS